METTTMNVVAISESMKLLSHPFRLTILALLKEREMCVCDIVEVLRTTQPNASQHLKKLKDGGLIHETRRSQWIYYSLNMDDKPHLKPILEHLPSMREQVRSLKPNSC